MEELENTEYKDSVREEANQEMTEQEKVEQEKTKQEETVQEKAIAPTIETSLTQECVRPYIMIDVKDIDRCQNFLDEIIKSTKQIYNCLDAIDSYGSYEIGRISAYAEIVKNMICKED